MSSQKATIGFDNFRINCVIGIEPHERTNKQEILVDVKIRTDASCVTQTQNIKDTIDYVHMAKICRDVADKGSYLLLEAYVSAVLDELISEFKIEWAWMRAKKPLAIQEADYAYVEMQKDVK